MMIKFIWREFIDHDSVKQDAFARMFTHETVRRVLKNELKPWKVRGWILSPLENSDFVAHMEQVLDVYKEPYNENCPVVCMDESSKQLIKETRIPIKMKKGKGMRGKKIMNMKGAVWQTFLWQMNH